MKQIIAPVFTLLVLSATSLFAHPVASGDVTENYDEFEQIDLDTIEEEFDGLIEKYQADYGFSFQYFDSLGTEFPLKDYGEDIQNGRYEKVIIDAGKVLSVIPDDPFAEYCLMVGLSETKRTKELFDHATRFYLDYPCDTYAITFIDYLSTNRVPDFYDYFAKEAQSKLGTGVYEPMIANIVRQKLGSVALENGYLKDVIAIADNIISTTEDPDPEYAAKDLKATAYIRMEQADKALELLDSYPEDQQYKGWVLNKSVAIRNAKGVDESLKFLEEYIKGDDVSYELIENYIIELTLAERYEEVVALVDSTWAEIVEENGLPAGEIRETAGTLDTPTGYLLLLRRGIANLYTGEVNEAKADFEKVQDRDDVLSLYVLARAYLGDRETAIPLTEKKFQWSPSYQASVYNVLGDADKALEKLEVAYSNSYWTPTATRYDINQRSLLGDPRFVEVARKFNPEGKNRDQR